MAEALDTWLGGKMRNVVKFGEIFQKILKKFISQNILFLAYYRPIKDPLKACYPITGNLQYQEENYKQSP